MNPQNPCEECRAVGGDSNPEAWTADDSNYCGVGVLCSEGACLTDCGGVPVDLANDALHCGACFHACARGLFCDQSQCTCDLSQPLIVNAITPPPGSFLAAGDVIRAGQ